MGGIRYYPPMLDQTFFNNLIAYLGGPDSNNQITTPRILLQNGFPGYALNGWESPNGGGKIYGAMIDAVNAAIITGEVNGYTDSVPANPTGTASTTGVMCGLAVKYTPTRSGVVLVQVECQLQNNTAGDGAEIKLYYGTAPAPANQANPTGTQKGQPAIIDAVGTASKRQQVGITTVIQGLTLNTQYWFDLLEMTITGGTAAVTGIEVVITEL